MLPSWSREGGRTALEERLKDAETAKRIRDDVATKLESASRIQLVSCSHNLRWIGRSLEEVAAAEKKEIVDLVLEIESHGGA